MQMCTKPVTLNIIQEKHALSHVEIPKVLGIQKIRPVTHDADAIHYWCDEYYILPVCP